MTHAYLNTPAARIGHIGCNKAGFENRKQARRALGKMGKPDGRPVASSTTTGTVLQSYKCRACGLWHLGHG